MVTVIRAYMHKSYINMDGTDQESTEIPHHRVHTKNTSEMFHKKRIQTQSQHNGAE